VDKQQILTSGCKDKETFKVYLDKVALQQIFTN